MEILQLPIKPWTYNDPVRHTFYVLYNRVEYNAYFSNDSVEILRNPIKYYNMKFFIWTVK